MPARCDGNNEAVLGALMLVLLIGFLVGMWLVRSHYEASTYQKLTGADVTMWDAMWVELRVQEGTKGE
jgi:hypothetical protein